MKKFWDKWTEIALVKENPGWSDSWCDSWNRSSTGHRNRNSG